MKKINLLITFIILLLCMTIVPVRADTKRAYFNACVDGDTIKVIIDDETKTVRLLAIDTPETKHPKKQVQPFGKEASTYTCDRITNAKKIVLEYDENSDKVDKYYRLLAWVWIDDKLLQEELISIGYAKTAYLYHDYKYTDKLQKLEGIAKEKKIGIWQEQTSTKEIPSYIYIIIIIVIIMLIIFIPKYRKKAVKKLKKETKKRLNKYMNKVLK